MASDRKAFIRNGTQWVRETIKAARDEALNAGNPKRYVQEIDGKNGRGFHPGSIANASNSAKVTFIASDLAVLANKVRPALLSTIADIFPNTKTGALRSNWGWFVFRGGNAKGGKGAGGSYVGPTIPPTIGVYDVMFLVPLGPRPVPYAWFANNAVKNKARPHNMIRKRSGESMMRRKSRGYLSEATTRIRRTLGKNAGINVTGLIVRPGHGLTSQESRSHIGEPVIRVAFRNLKKPVLVE